MITLTVKAADPRQGFTLDQLARFVQDALRQDVPGTATVHVQIGWRGQIRQATVSDEARDRERQP